MGGPGAIGDRQWACVPRDLRGLGLDLDCEAATVGPDRPVGDCAREWAVGAPPEQSAGLRCALALHFELDPAFGFGLTMDRVYAVVDRTRQGRRTTDTIGGHLRAASRSRGSAGQRALPQVQRDHRGESRASDDS